MLKRNKSNENFKNTKKGQSTVEYIVLVGVIIGVAVVFMASPNSPFRTTMNRILNSTSNVMENMANRLAVSYPSDN